MLVDTLSARREFQRKCIHIACSAIPLAYYFFLNREQIIIISCFLSVGFLIAELSRFHLSWAKRNFENIFLNLLREDEKRNKITGATVLFIAMTFTFVLFEKNSAVSAALVLTLADSLAAVTGKSVGRIKIFNKSLEGSVAFFIAAIVIFILCAGSFHWMYPVFVLILTLIELLPLPVNDNLTLPLATGFMLEYLI